MVAANNTIDETLALITAANTVVQNPDAVGTAFKTISMRIRGAKTELEEAGLETEGMVQSTAKLRQEIMALSGVDIMEADGQTFKSTYVILDELALKWKDLSDIQQATITELIAGKRQGNIISSLMNNFQTARDALETSLGASGSAMKEHAKWSESLEARLNKLKATWQSLSQSFLNSDFLKIVIESLKILVDILDKVTRKLGTFGTIGLGAGIFGLFKNRSSFSGILGSLSSFGQLASEAWRSGGKLIDRFKGVGKAAGMAGGDIAKSFTGSLSGIVGGIGLAVSAIGLIVSAYKNYREEISRARQETIQSSNEFLDAAGSFEQAYIKYSGRTDLTVEEEAELESAIKGTVDALGDKSSALQDTVNSSNDYIASLEAITKAELKAAESIAKEKKVAAEKELKDVVKPDILGALDAKTSSISVVIERRKKNKDNPDDASEDEKIAREAAGKYYGFINSDRAIKRYGFQLPKNASVEEIVDYYYTLIEAKNRLIEENLTENDTFDAINVAINKVSDAVATYENGLYDLAKAQYESQNGIPKTTEEYLKMRESILNEIGGTTDTRKTIANTLDSEYGQMFDLTSAEIQSKKLIGVVDDFDEERAREVEVLLNMRTAVNNGECSVGEYISEFDKVDAIARGFGKEDYKEIALAFGLDTDSIKEQYKDLKIKLTDDYYKIEMSDDDAKTFLDNLSFRELSASRDLFSSNNEDFKNILKGYSDTLNEAKKESVDFSKTVFGNIDTNARKTLEWTSENLEKYKDELMSFEPDGAKWEDVKKNYEGTISTVMGMWDTFEIDGKKVDIAFSPMLQTDSGVEVLSGGTLDSYIKELIAKATEDGKWTNEELLKLDAEGLEIDGQKIKGVLADIGNTAQQTASQMHFVGKDGALALAEKELFAIIEAQAKINDALNFSASIEVDKTALETFNTALEESASAMGLSEESIDSLSAKYKNLESYDPSLLFEATANGVKVNREELAKLEKEYNNLSKTKVQEHLDTLTDKYNDVTAEIDKCTNAAERAKLINERETYKTKIEELAEYQSQLEGVTGAYQRWIDAQNAPENYEGYEAVATSREDIKDEIGRGFISNASKEYIDLLSGKDLQGGTIDDYANAWGKLDDKITGAGHSINDFFTVNDDGDITATGIDRFFKSLQTDFKGSVANFDKETKKWTYDFGSENLEKIQEKWGIGIEAIELLLEAAVSAGYDIDWGGILDGIDLDTSNFETLVSAAEVAQEAFNKLDGVDDVNFNFTATGVKEATTEVDKAREAYNKLITNKDGTINLNANGAEEMRLMLATLLIQKQQLEDSNIVMNVDTSQLDKSQEHIGKAINAVINFREKYKNLEIAVSTGQGIEEAKTELNTAMTELQGLGDKGVDIAAQLMLGEGTDGATLKSKVDAAIKAVGSQDIKVGCKLDETALGTLNSQVLTNFNPEATVTITKIDESLVNQYITTEKTADGTVKWKNDESLVVEFQNKTHEAKGIVNWANNVEKVKTNFSANGTVKWSSGNKVKVSVVSEAKGTANASGTTGSSGRAFARGDWGIKGNGTALGGELGQELVVRDGKFFTIGDKGAEFFHYKQNDIIFNAAQTESLFKYGGIKGAKPRGTMLAGGTAFAEGRAFPWSATGNTSNFASNRQNTKTETKTTKKNNSVTTTTTTSWSANAKESDFVNNRNSKAQESSSGKSSSSKSKETEKEFEETIDWVEVALKRIQREIDNLDQKAGNVYKTWSSRNNALAKQISEVGDEINLQKQAYERYMQEANSVGLDESWAKKVRDGTIDIETITDEDLKEKIDDYQDWYEKALDCKDAIEELKETEASLYAQRFDNIQSQYDAILQGYEHTEAMLNEYIAQAETKGHIVSKKYYEALISNEKSNISELKKEQSALIAERDKAVADGKIEKYSEEWYRMCNDIDSVTQAIEESTTALLEYDNAMREIDWSIFDLIQERISSVTEEADFLVELMSNKKLFDDDGKLASQGLATMGLHAQNYNTHMYAADTYGAEVAKLDKQIAKDPYDQELINRRNELLELQRESILAAEDEKNAIRDMVEEGINLELDALQELIDKKNEELESERDLYEYQKKVKEQTEEIASLEKQMAAYSGDDSDEAKQKIQQIKVDLEAARQDLQETEYDKLIDDTSAMLDTLYNEYELILNTRLDNIDHLLESVIESINAAASADGTIASALGSEGAIAIAVSNNATSIKDTLASEAKNVGLTLSSAMNNIWSVGEGNAKSVLTMYGEDFRTKSTTIITTLNGIKSDIAAMVDDVDKDAKKKTTANKTATSAKKSPTTTTTTKKPDTDKPTTTKPTTSSGGDGKPKVGDKVKFISGKYYYDSQGKKPLGSKYQGKEVYITNINTKSWATHPYHISTGTKLGKGDLGWLKLNQISGYATGKKKIPNNEYAWTQENGQEYIVRPSDGAILTPVAKDDSILNAAASGNIWNMANNPAEFIKDNLKLDNSNIPNGSNVNNTYSQHIDNVVFRMDNVKNYEELLYAMQKDKNFEKLILSMSVDRLAGKSSLAKGKSIR